MTSFFLSILNISFTAAIVAIAVILLRLLFKKAPRWITCLLWALVGLRLLFPFAIESKLSVIPSTDMFTVASTPQSSDVLKVHTGNNALNNTVNQQLTSMPEPQQALELMDILAIVWVSVAALVLIYGIISYMMMFLRVRTAIPLKKNIYQSENVKSPFVLGFIKPKIYIPFNLSGRTLKYVLAHEEAHIKRKDHIVKPFAYLLLCFHWFNPLMWLSYVLLCRDIEVACDEKVIKDYSINKRKNYAFALLNCKVNRSNIAVCPVAFGEVNVSDRIKKTLCYKKPAMWIIALAIVISVISSGCLLTNPKAETTPEETPTVNEVYPVETTEASSESNLTESTTAAETTIAPTEALQTQSTDATDAAEAEPSESVFYENEESDYTFEEPKTIQSFDEYYDEVIRPQIEAEIMQKRYDALKADTRNHSDECPCSSCEELREAGIYPRETTPAPTLTVILPVDNSNEYEEPTNVELPPLDIEAINNQIAEAYREEVERKSIYDNTSNNGSTSFQVF